MDKRYIACCSGGKDSVAMIILAHIHNEPLDEIVFSEVMFDKNISGELPEHMDFIHNVLKPQCEAWGYKFTILHSEKTYLDLFNHLPVRGKNFGTGMKLGFPMAGACGVNRDCKLKPIKDFLKGQDCIEYVGIAIDEPKRLARLTENKVSLLAKYGYTEKMAKDLCIQYGLLSPVYEFTKRGGCWFCPNARHNELCHLYNNHRELMEMLVELEKQIPKKPNVEGDGYADGRLVYDTWICPHCEIRYEIDYDDYAYCPNCGQAIDRSDIQE